MCKKVKKNHKQTMTFDIPQDPLVTCINTPGGFTCGACPPGYTGTGHYCSDIDECLVVTIYKLVLIRDN